FWTLVIGIAVLAFFPGSDVGDPVAVLQIQPTTAPDAAAPESDSATEAPAPPGAAEPAPPAEAKGQMDLPPGFGVPSPAPQAPLVPAPPGHPARPGKPRSSRRLRDRRFRWCRHSPRRPMMLRRRTIPASKGPHPL